MSAARPNGPRQVLSLADSLRQSADQIKELLTDLALQPGDELWDSNAAARANGLILTGPPFAWPPLALNGKRIQSRLRKEYGKYYQLLHEVLRHESNEVTDSSHYSTSQIVTQVIERRNVSEPTKQRALSVALRAIDEQLARLNDVYSEHERLTLVPDTNALYWNTDLETWRAPTRERFLIILTPTVIEELDRHKDDHSKKARRQKAAKLVRKIAEYRRRGSLVDGVTLVRGVSDIFAFPFTADPRAMFAWLPATGADDYVLAEAASVMRANPRAPTAIVTRDVNLQTRIEFARLSFWTPDVVAQPEPSAPADDGAAVPLKSISRRRHATKRR
jgi:hypothetical protein